ncbi:hypothetical protein RJT34_24575 [Clitoria ternatea]|uniref:Uncharacterized protein n=1 Tax=Clitoria ternatea TaxID=43366 RepID=A0AAN9FN50_CLITE
MGASVDNSSSHVTKAGIGNSMQQALDTEIGLSKMEDDFVFPKEGGISSEPSLGNDDLSAEKRYFPLCNQLSSDSSPTEPLTSNTSEKVHVNINPLLQLTIPKITPKIPPVIEN